MNRAREVSVLVVDDDFMVASIHARFVERVPGFRVVGQAATGAGALAEVDRLDPDLLLLDVHLPDLSGIEVLRQLRGAGHDVGVMMVTAAREADTVRAAAAAGAAHYLVKPFGFDDLAARLEAFRRTHLAFLGAEEGGDADFGQREIDAVFAPLAGAEDRGGRALPKGLSPQTATAVRSAVEDAADLSAAECAELVGISRVSARRYLEHFVVEGSVVVGLRYGGAGRPERRYRTA